MLDCMRIVRPNFSETAPRLRSAGWCWISTTCTITTLETSAKLLQFATKIAGTDSLRAVLRRPIRTRLTKISLTRKTILSRLRYQERLVAARLFSNHTTSPIKEGRSITRMRRQSHITRLASLLIFCPSLSPIATWLPPTMKR